MVGKLLVRGMLAGVVAGLLTFAFARVAGEPQVEHAISFEEKAQAAKGEAPEPELVSRSTQSGLGLLTGVVVYGTAIGGLFALVFAYAQGRVRTAGAQPLAAWLALAGFVAIVLVPTLKYPANPPSVGDPETIGMRTGLFFLMLACSIIAMVIASKVRGALAARLGAWNASLAAGAVFVILAALAIALLPEINEVPADFPATVLWKFRVAALGMQAVMWTALGSLFGLAVEQMHRAALPGRRLAAQRA